MTTRKLYLPPPPLPDPPLPVAVVVADVENAALVDAEEVRVDPVMLSIAVVVDVALLPKQEP